MKKRIFITIQYLEIGGAERSLIGLLDAIDYSKYEVDLFVYRHTGEFMRLVSGNVHLLPEIKKYATLARPLKDIFKEGHWDIVLGRLYAHWKNARFMHSCPKKDPIAIFQYVASYTTPFLPSFFDRGEYDLAISFLTPHNIVRDKVKAKQKWAWIHTDYSTVEVDKEMELPVWNAYDRIISISESVSQSFVTCFPSLEKKLTLIENILSEKFVREQAEEPADLGQLSADGIRLCTIARFSYPKAIDRAVHICSRLIEKKLDVYWYIIGYGTDEQKIKEIISETHMEKHFILLGKKTNPYPYIKACDIYVQPSRYEGKAVTVREAQILAKPVVITDYPTASSQLTDGVDGVIVPNDVEGAAQGIADFITDKVKQEAMSSYLREHHYGNEDEVKKIDALLGV